MIYFADRSFYKWRWGWELSIDVHRNKGNTEALHKRGAKDILFLKIVNVYNLLNTRYKSFENSTLFNFQLNSFSPPCCKNVKSCFVVQDLSWLNLFDTFLMVVKIFIFSIIIWHVQFLFVRLCDIPTDVYKNQLNKHSKSVVIFIQWKLLKEDNFNMQILKISNCRFNKCVECISAVTTKVYVHMKYLLKETQFFMYCSVKL